MVAKCDYILIVVDVKSEKMPQYREELLSYFTRQQLTKQKDYCRLILMNSDDTKNNLYDEESYKHIYVATDIKTFDVNDIKHLSSTQSGSADWIETLIVALNYMKNDVECLSGIVNRQILLFSDFEQPGSENTDLLQCVINGVERMKAQLFIFGPAVLKKPASNWDDIQVWMSEIEFKEPVSEVQRENHRLLKRLVDETGCVVCDLELGLTLALYYKLPAFGMTWNVDISLKSLTIPISAYKIAFDSPAVQMKKMDFEGRVFTPSNVVWYEDDEESKEVSVQDKIPVYVLHGHSIPMPTDKERMNTTRGIHIVGFTDRKNISELYFSQSNTYAILPNPKKQECHSFHSLFEQMIEENVCAIAQKVYNNTYRPSLVTLIPHEENGLKYLIMAQLPYASQLYMSHHQNPTSKKVDENLKDATRRFLHSLKIEQNDANELENVSNIFSEKVKLNENIQEEYRTLGKHYAKQVLDLDLFQEARAEIQPDQFLKERAAELFLDLLESCKKYKAA